MVVALQWSDVDLKVHNFGDHRKIEINNLSKFVKVKSAVSTEVYIFKTCLNAREC